MTRPTSTDTLPGDYRPIGAPDPVADTLAHVYALILSWPIRDEEKLLKEDVDVEQN